MTARLTPVTRIVEEATMLCDRCGEREATVHARAVDADSGATLRTTHVCDVCAQTPRRVTGEDVAGVLALEASGRAMPPGLLAMAAADFVRRAAYHGEALPPAVQAFVDRHGAPA